MIVVVPFSLIFALSTNSTSAPRGAARGSASMPSLPQAVSESSLVTASVC